MNKEFEEAVSSFYKLKQTYEEKQNLYVTKLRTNTALTNKERASNFKKFSTKCINCGKNGGTKFIITENMLKATCGNSSQACKLDINIQKAVYKPIQELLNEALNSKNYY